MGLKAKAAFVTAVGLGYIGFINKPGGDWFDCGLAGSFYQGVCHKQMANDRVSPAQVKVQAETDSDKVIATPVLTKSEADLMLVSEGKAIAALDADAIVGALYEEHDLISLDDMKHLAKIVRDKAAADNPEVLDLAEYKRVKQENIYKNMSPEAKKKFDELMPAGMR